MAKKKISDWPRHGVQAVWAFLSNSYLAGFLQGKIYQGKLKNLCVPGLNCYSCPGALGACPIGALQAVWELELLSWLFMYRISHFVGALVGRLSAAGLVIHFGIAPGPVA